MAEETAGIESKAVEDEGTIATEKFDVVRNNRTLPEDASDLMKEVVDTLRKIFDPEMPANIYDLGLIYKIEIKGRNVFIEMTLTSPACPVAQTLPVEIAQKIEEIGQKPEQESVICKYGLDDEDIEIVWDPPWAPAMMSEEAQLELGFI